MERLRRTLSLPWRKKEEKTDERSSKPPKKDKISVKSSQRSDDERAVRSGICNFQVKYLGHVEVEDSRGIHLCEQAIQALLNQKSKHVKAMLHITGDSLRVIDRIDKILLVDQTIEKVSFCSHDRHYEKGFAYICRDGTTRRWLCHGFLAQKIPGERLSHAVGCAFRMCLERKQKYQRENNLANEKSRNFRLGSTMNSFRSLSLEERMIDPQSAILIDPIRSFSDNISKIELKINERPRPKTFSPIESQDENQKQISVLFSSNSTALSQFSSLNDETCRSSMDKSYSFKSDFGQSFESDSSQETGHVPFGSPIGFSQSVPDQTSYFDAWNSNLTLFNQDDQCIQSFSFEDCSPIGEFLPVIVLK